MKYKFFWSILLLFVLLFSCPNVKKEVYIINTFSNSQDSIKVKILVNDHVLYFGSINGAETSLSFNRSTIHNEYLNKEINSVVVELPEWNISERKSQHYNEFIKVVISISSSISTKDYYTGHSILIPKISIAFFDSSINGIL